MKSSPNQMPRALAAEAIGTFFLLATIVGSGIMADSLAGGNGGLALLCNAIATGAMLVVLILVFGPVSGAHFNPAVTLHFVLTCRMEPKLGTYYVCTQILSAILGVLAAHAMFDVSLIAMGTTARDGGAQWLGEFLATFALLSAIIGCLRHRPEAVPYAVGLVIVAGYWYTSSTSFANPAVTIARALTDTFAAIRPQDVVPFSIAQLAGAVAATAFFRWLSGHDPIANCRRFLSWTCETQVRRS